MNLKNNHPENRRQRVSNEDRGLTKTAAVPVGDEMLVDREKQGDQANKITEEEEIRGSIGVIQGRWKIVLQTAQRYCMSLIFDSL